MSNKQNSIQLSTFVKSIPFANRALIITVTVLWAFDFTGFTSKILMNNPNQVWTPNYEIWRILTASFCLNSLFQILVAAVNLYTFYPKLEAKASSILVIVNFIVVGTVIQTLFSILYLFLPAQLNNLVYFGDFCGIWLNLIFKYCYFNANTKIKLCCFNLYIPKISYPFIFLLFISILNLSIKLDALIGILVAFIECKFFNGTIITKVPSFLCGFCTKFQCWVPDQKNSQNFYIGLQQQLQTQRWSKSTADVSNQDYFKNKKGYKLSEG